MMRNVPHSSRTAAALLALLASVFSIVVVSLGSGRFGRDIGVDWMVMASVLFRDAAWDTEAGATVMIVGLLIHLTLHAAWALLFFIGLGRWTTRLTPGPLLLIAPVWALITSAAEWLVIMPLVLDHAFFTLEKAYWASFAVHLVSASVYPLFPALRDAIADRGPSPFRRFGAAYAASAIAFVAILGVVAAFGHHGREPPHAGGDIGWDRDFMRRMGAHHEQGLEIARLGRINASDPYLGALARFMTASQHGEIRAMERWWRSWFDEPPALVCSQAEMDVMPGMLSAAQMAALRRLSGRAFDEAFIDAMTAHHRGAVAMADEAIRRASDPRLVLLSRDIRHEQRGEILLMRRVEGLDAVRLAVRALYAPFGAHAADTPDGLDAVAPPDS